MTYFNVKVGRRTIPVPVPDAVRVSHENLERMASDLLAQVEQDRTRLMFDLTSPDQLEQYYVATGDAMIHAHVSRDFDGRNLHVELYVCKIERSTMFQL